MITPIPIKLPPSFEEALGYNLNRQWAAFYWEPCGDEAMYNDGYCSAQCNWWAFLQFTRHPIIRTWLAGYNFGSSEEDAIHWLLCDLNERTVFVGTKVEVETFLIDNARQNEPPVTIEPKPLTPEDIADMLKSFRAKMREMPIPTIAEVEAIIKKNDIAVNNMVNEIERGNRNVNN